MKLAGALVIVAGLFGTLSGAQAGLLSPSEGAIKHVMLAIPPDDFDQGARLTGFAVDSLNMITGALGPDVHYLVHAYPAHRAAIEAAFSSAGVKQLSFVPSAYGHFTRWTRDMFTVSTLDRTKYWLLPKTLLRRLDASVAPEVAVQIGQQTKQLPFNIEGGNLIAFGVWVFAGKDLLLDGPQQIDIKRRSVLKQAMAPDSNWIWIGNKQSIPYAAATGIYQPIFHIDMFVTPVAKAASARPHLIVGSTRLAQELSGKPSPAAIERRLDEIAVQLQGMGFSVSRIPLLVIYEENAVSVFSYNNVLFDGKDSRTVLLPQYATQDISLQSLDDNARSHYQQLGYQVRPVRGPWRELGRQLGGLRCLVQVVARE